MSSSTVSDHISSHSLATINPNTDSLTTLVSSRSDQPPINTAEGINSLPTSYSASNPRPNSTTIREPSAPVDHGISANETDDLSAEPFANSGIMSEFAYGAHPELWYKFKRFETLGLHNLYLLQDELVRFQRDVDYRAGHMTIADSQKLRGLLKEYYEFLQLFTQVSRLKRPPMAERKEAIACLARALQEDHYRYAADAYGMVDLTPQTLGVEADKLRVVLGGLKTLRMNTDDTLENYAKRQGDSQVEIRSPHKRPLPTGPLTENIARICMAILSGVLVLVPIIALSYIESLGYRLLTTCLFVMVFAIVASLAVTGTNNELITITAAYAAVLVVFLGQTG